MLSKNNRTANSSEAYNFIDNLYYQRDDTWFPLQGWAKFFLKLGEHLSHLEFENSRFIAALAVPTRSYASTLIASGIVCGRSLLPHERTDQEYFDILKALDNGTPVVYRDKHRKYKAKKRDVILDKDKSLIGIQLDEGVMNTTVYISAEKARMVEVSNRESVKLPHQQKGREISPPCPLIKAIMGDDHVYDFILESRLENIIVGPINLLKQELQVTLADTQSSRADCPGRLSDLIRVREFQSPGIAYRSSILAAVSKTNIKVAEEVSPFIVTFDSSLGFVKWRDYWRRFNWVIILDHTDPNFQYAVTQINNEHLYRTEKQHKVKIPTLPPGVEMMFFTTDF